MLQFESNAIVMETGIVFIIIEYCTSINVAISNVGIAFLQRFYYK